MEYFRTFKTLAKQAADRAAFLREVPYRRAAPILGKDVLQGTEADSPAAALGERDALFVMTDSGADREGDIIVSAGVDFKQFESYGSILWGHRADEPAFVLGRPKQVIREDTRILTVAEFLDADANPTADRVLRMIQSGGVRAMSVGLMILEYSEANDRPGFMPWNILRSEVVESSVTPVPMNPRAVLEAAGGEAGSSEAEAVAELFEETADTPEEVQRSSVELALTADQVKSLIHETLKTLTGEKTISVPNKSEGDALGSTLSYFARRVAE